MLHKGLLSASAVFGPEKGNLSFWFDSGTLDGTVHLL